MARHTLGKASKRGMLARSLHALPQPPPCCVPPTATCSGRSHAPMHGPAAQRGHTLPRHRQRLRLHARLGLENRELMVGDAVTLASFALWKQISAIVLSPSFPGWLAPLEYNPVRFVEFFAFASTLIASWGLSSFLVGGYRSSSLDVPETLRTTSLTWLVSMPVAAAQLVLSTAAESSALVGDEGWVSSLPLAASGPGEPFATAAGVLGVMSMWRTFYVTHLDMFSAADLNQWYRFREAVAMVCMMAATSFVVLAGLQAVLTPEDIEQLSAGLL